VKDRRRRRRRRKRIRIIVLGYIRKIFLYFGRTCCLIFEGRW
jgi:hypothetical protein